ncbi:glucuronate isomerase [Secundilactobacillus mixtipabuli]|uniref:Uronate isomerase n=1 Tax=Secundilactobacillus mixtipabuli TaxID=1435342 RepID=A0A1Z5IEQ8_9LACO|nr:glucuronate isomerase [Secundilactobacillus mixtipabuli]GAX00265.1 glucuronate isomerase [Secundilactobacillus mixtipabuli]
MKFLDDDFLLTTVMGRTLYHNYAEKMPIIDFHCHLDPKEIYENQNDLNLTQIWINKGIFGDHYKWRLMRANGVPEELITGEGDDYQKFVAWVQVLEKAIGNPLLEWSYLELKRYFGISEVINDGNIHQIWEQTKRQLATAQLKPRNLIKRSNVKVVCTTDDPVSDLKYHLLLKNEELANGFKVLPAMRPDRAMAITASDFSDYLNQLGKVADVQITNFKSLVTALTKRFEFFDSVGGRLSDCGLNTFKFVKKSEVELDHILNKARRNEMLTSDEINAYLTGFLSAFMRLNKRYNWTMQFHVNALRNVNLPMYQQLGPNTGFDSVGTQADMSAQLITLLADQQKEDAVPKTILYSLNPNDWMQLATGMGNFYSSNVVQKMQLGCAWWFNDNREGIREQLRIMAQQSLLGNSVGMLTDSRSFLSYPRHEYFRRVLCDYLGELVNRGQLPSDADYLGRLIADICYNNANRYFNFKV